MSTKYSFSTREVPKFTNKKTGLICFIYAGCFLKKFGPKNHMNMQSNEDSSIVFISYSHDSQEHKEWVLLLATDLVKNGIEVILDQWNLVLGGDVPKFMERSVSEADHVLMICTERYVRKADNGDGGTGYEAMIVTGELVRNLGTTKFIPIIRQKDKNCLVPKFASTKLYSNFSLDLQYDEKLLELLKVLHRVPLVEKPPLGINPFLKETSNEAVKSATDNEMESGTDIKTKEVISRTPPESWMTNYGEDEYGVWAEFTISNIVQRLRWIRPGSFVMGSPKSEKERSEIEVQHGVTLSQGYWLADTACSQELWEIVMKDNPSSFIDRDLPVESVSYVKVQHFIQKLNGIQKGLEVKLPSEAEWEYSCRSGTNTPFYFGETITSNQVNYNAEVPYGNGKKGEYREKTMAVKALKPNAWGLYQMHGNVWEWCEDWFADYDLNDTIDPKGPTDGDFRVLRGGSWFNYGWFCRSAYRNAYHPGYGNYFIGFRLSRGQ